MMSPIVMYMRKLAFILGFVKHKMNVFHNQDFVPSGGNISTTFQDYSQNF